MQQSGILGRAESIFFRFEHATFGDGADSDEECEPMV